MVVDAVHTVGRDVSSAYVVCDLILCELIPGVCFRIFHVNLVLYLVLVLAVSSRKDFNLLNVEAIL